MCVLLISEILNWICICLLDLVA